MKKINQRNYFVVIDDSEEMWTAVKFATKRAKSTKSNLTTISFIESIGDGMMLTSSTEKILDKEQISSEKIRHKEVYEFIYNKSKIKAKTEIFKINEIDEFINFLNSYSSNSTIILATSKDIGKPGPLIDKLIYEKGNSLHCPLVVINGNLEDKEIEKII
tara:strand:+ start:2014 stop:2493 length:480 start_codon:yes stop_codon:yes gene_type:complete